MPQFWGQWTWSLTRHADDIMSALYIELCAVVRTARVFGYVGRYREHAECDKQQLGGTYIIFFKFIFILYPVYNVNKKQIIKSVDCLFEPDMQGRRGERRSSGGSGGKGDMF